MIHFMPSTPSAIVITVPEADEVVERLRTPARDAWWRRMPAHITLLHPFVPDPDEGVVEELRFFFSRVDGFALTFNEVREFPGVVWLAPEQADDLRGLTEALVRRWPTCLPYEGQFDEITPHLTVAHTDDPARARQVREAAAAALPLKGQAIDASIWLREPEGWRRLADLPFAEAD
jgi:2'-5' RNA ligase